MLPVYPVENGCAEDLHNANKKPAINFNQTLAELVSRGAPYRYLALPGIGSAINLEELQFMALDAHNKNEDIISGAETRLRGLNKSILKDGQPVPLGPVLQYELKMRLDEVVNSTLPMIERLGWVKQDKQGCQKVMRALNIWLSPAGGNQKCSS